MPISAEVAQTLGAELLEAETLRIQIPLISARHEGLGLPDAYAIQSAFTQAKLDAGAVRKGWKIGLTSRAMQQSLGIDTPDSGMLLDDMFFDNGATIPSKRFIAPRIEAEIAFFIGRDIDPGASPADVVRATDYVCPALEILDTRIVRLDPETGRARTIIDTIADNAANAGIILGGQPRGLDSVDLRWIGAIVWRDGIVEETGLGAGVLGDPILGICWLSRRLGDAGMRISAGDVLLAGSFIRALEAPHGTTFQADFGPFGALSCRFD